MTINSFNTAINPAKWMSLIKDDAVLSRLSLPGTHESMSRYGYGSECQNWNLTEQLNNGIRVFDIRLRYLEGQNGQVNFAVHHSDEYQYAFFDSNFPYTSDCKYFVLDQCLDFLRQNDQECIVLLIKQEKDVQDQATFFDAFWKIIDNRDQYNNKSLDKLFYEGNTVPRLIDARGRIIFAFVDGDESEQKYKLSAPRWGLYWGNIDYAVDSGNLQPGQQPGLDVENHWSDLMDSKWGKVTTHLDAALTTGPSATLWYLTFLSASRVPDVTHFPNDYADYLLPKLKDYLNVNLKKATGTWPWGAYFGTVLMDFPTQDVIDLLISTSCNYQYP